MFFYGFRFKMFYISHSQCKQGVDFRLWFIFLLRFAFFFRLRFAICFVYFFFLIFLFDSILRIFLYLVCHLSILHPLDMRSKYTKKQRVYVSPSILVVCFFFSEIEWAIERRMAERSHHGYWKIVFLLPRCGAMALYCIIIDQQQQKGFAFIYHNASGQKM